MSTRSSRARVIAATKGALRGSSLFTAHTGNRLPGAIKRQRELKARLKRARTATVKPKGRLPNPTYTGTNHFVSKSAAIRYYRDYGYNAEDVAQKIKSGEIRIGKPLKRAGQRLELTDGGKRYVIVENPGFFGPEARASAKRVTKIRRVQERDTREGGEIIGVQPGGFVKVKWDNRQRPTLIKRSEIKRYPGLRMNPGIMDLAGSVQAIEYLADKAGPGKRRRRNPRILRLLEQKRNPTVAAMSRTFQGSANGQAQEFYASDYAPRLDFSRGGKLVFLKLAGTTIRVPGAVVAIDPRTSKLWIAQQPTADGRPPTAGMFKRKAARKGELLDYGPIDAICYLTSKKHIEKGRTFEYVHNFGEEGGRKPRLMIDHDGMPILKGGDYKIESRGIVN